MASVTMLCLPPTWKNSDGVKNKQTEKQCNFFSLILEDIFQFLIDTKRSGQEEELEKLGVLVYCKRTSETRLFQACVSCSVRWLNLGTQGQ